MNVDLWPLWVGGVLWALGAYLCGSISFAVVVSRLFGLSDPRTFGSHNPGATNVLRTGNKLAALLTLLLDALKGWIALVLAKSYLLQNPFLSPGSDQFALQQELWLQCTPWLLGLVALSAFLGHLWPVFFGFKGGKGVATAAGVLFAMQPMLGVMVLFTWLGVAALTRYSSLSALTSAALAPLYMVIGSMYLWQDEAANASPWPFALVSAIMAALLIYRHKENVARLLSGQESKIFSKKKS
jgi:glycerol-3-phosphate acyltransferase PlsY